MNKPITITLDNYCKVDGDDKGSEDENSSQCSFLLCEECKRQCTTRSDDIFQVRDCGSSQTKNQSDNNGKASSEKPSPKRAQRLVKQKGYQEKRSKTLNNNRRKHYYLICKDVASRSHEFLRTTKQKEYEKSPLCFDKREHNKHMESYESNSKERMSHGCETDKIHARYKKEMIHTYDERVYSSIDRAKWPMCQNCNKRKDPNKKKKNTNLLKKDLALRKKELKLLHEFDKLKSTNIKQKSHHSIPTKHQRCDETNDPNSLIRFKNKLQGKNRENSNSCGDEVEKKDKSSEGRRPVERYKNYKKASEERARYVSPKGKNIHYEDKYYKQKELNGMKTIEASLSLDNKPRGKLSPSKNKHVSEACQTDFQCKCVLQKHLCDQRTQTANSILGLESSKKTRNTGVDPCDSLLRPIQPNYNTFDARLKKSNNQDKSAQNSNTSKHDLHSNPEYDNSRYGKLLKKRLHDREFTFTKPSGTPETSSCSSLHTERTHRKYHRTIEQKPRSDTREIFDQSESYDQLTEESDNERSRKLQFEREFKKLTKKRRNNAI